jgi:3-phenylpropionate/cinnamic acid dioxygenase small subunit
MSDPSMAALADRVAQLEDERAVVTTLYAYGSALDYGDRDMFLDCFTPDADYVVEMRVGAEGNFRCRGHDELGAYFDGHTHAPAAWHKHVTVNPTVTSTGDTATATTYFLRVDAAPTSGPATVLASGRYTDELVRADDGKWRIRSRRCEVENL